MIVHKVITNFQPFENRSRYYNKRACTCFSALTMFAGNLLLRQAINSPVRVMRMLVS
ncbi:hypothetical protein [Mucilaginibacter sp. RCC_168]|uniref:hypothetical protein n=1 Tax=Mucilaginibacter sp. RCC_168 TaxID=3239221 RepID=UPI00352601E8